MIELYEYQKKGVEFLKAHRHCLLADEMGLGKTIQAIQAAKELGAKSILVICPAVAKYNWQKEFSEFGLMAHVLELSGGILTSKIQICSFEFETKHKSNIQKRKWDLIIVDEAHYLKEPTAQRTQAVLGIKGLIHHAQGLWAMSGTPAPNHAGELWVWLKTFGLTTLSYEGFIGRYCNAHHVGNRYSRVQITGTNTKHSHELKVLLRKFALRRLKKDELDLPPITHNPYYIEPATDAEVFALAPHLKDKLSTELEILKEKLDIELTTDDDKILSSLGLLSQSISSLRRYHAFKKLTPTVELLHNELWEGQYKKVVLFGIHKDVLHTLKDALYEFKPVIITGEVDAIIRAKAVEQFQNDAATKIFIGNIQAAGTAITLTRSNQVVFIEQDWVPGNNAQAGDRCHRIGQTEPVTCRHIAIKDSIDEKITATIARKTRELSTFL